MSKTIDQRVVEMRFDNAQFERETKTTMSTLDKLKSKLNLTGASKGLEKINKASKNNSLPVLGNAAEAVGAKFSALQVMGVTALANITNSAVNAGKRIVESLTIAPIKDGFQEYEMTLNAVQTTMAATGKTAEEVEKELKKLDEYADKTVYSTADMLNNLPKFTNAGVELESATKAMIGIANATALAGGDASKASIAFYNLGQAIGTGYLTRMDYNSINNAGIATMKWKEQMVEAAIAQGTLTKVGEDAYQAGNKTLTLQQLFIDGLQEQWATTEVMMKVFGDYGDETTEIGKKSYAAAQDIKTFSMMMDSLKATAGTGWKETWESIFGGLEPAKKFWTGLSNFLSNIIEGIADWRNNLVKKVMGNPLSELFQTIIGNLNKGSILEKPLSKVTDALDNLDEVATRVIRGEFGNAPVRYEKLAKAGYNYALVQNRVNEMLGSSFRHNVELAESEKELDKTNKSVNKTRGETIDQLVKMSDAELKSIGLRQVDINALRALEEQSKKTGIPIKELADDLSLLNGRTLLINSFKNIGDALVGTFTSLKNAWKDIFPGDGSETIYNIIAGFHKLTTYLEVNDETAEKLTRTFKGVFALLDVVLTLAAGPLKIAFKALTGLLGAFDLDILDVTATIGDAIVKFRDWIDAIVDFDKVFEILVPYITSAGKAIGDWIDKNIDLAGCLEKITGYLDNLKTAVSDWIEGLKNTDNVPLYIMQTLGSGLDTVKDFVVKKVKEIGTSIFEGMMEFALLDWSSVPSDIMEGFEKGLGWGILSVIKKIKTFCNKFITTVKDIFIIQSPSHVMFEIGQFVIQGFLNGIMAMYDLTINAIKSFFTRTRDTVSEVDFEKPLDTIISGIKGFGSKVAEVFGGIDFGKIIAAALGVGMLVVAKKAIDVLEMFGKPLDGLGDMLSGIGEAFEGFGKNLKASAMLKRAKALLVISGAIMILVMAIIPLTELSWEQLGKAAASLVVLSGVVVGLYALLNLIGGIGEGTSVKSTLKLLAVTGSLFLLAFAVKSLSQIAIDGNVEQTIKMLTAVVSGLAVLMFSFGLFVNADKAGNMDKAGAMIFKMAAALLTLTSVIKIVSGFTYSDITKGITFILGVGVLFTAITVVSKFAGEHADKAGAMLFKMSIAMLLMAGVVKIVAGMSEDDIKKGLIFVAGVELLFAGLIAISNLSGGNASKAGKMILKMSAAMLIMIFTIKIIAGMSITDIVKGIAAVSALSVLFAGIIAVSKYAGEHAIKAGVLLLAMSTALLIMVGITFIVSNLDQKEMWKAVGFVAALEAMFAGLIFITKYAKATDKLKVTLILFLVAIGLMVAAVIGLSFIDPKSLAMATGAISSIMGMFAALMVATKFTKNTKNMRKSLLTLLAVTAVLAGIIIALAKLNPESAIEASEALSLLLLSFSSSIFILGKAGKISKSVSASLAPMLAIAAGLALIVAAFALLNKYGMESSIQSIGALALLLNAFSTSIVILGKAGSVSKSALSALTPMLLIAAGLGGILAVFGVLNKYGMEASTQSALSLGILLNAFATSIVILGRVGSVSKSALSALQPMLLVAAGLGGILAVLGVLNKYGIEPSISSTIALGILLNAFSTAIAILGVTGPGIKTALPALQPMMLVVAELAIILGLMSALNVEASIPSAIALGVLLNLLAASMVILSFVGPTATAAIPAAICMGLVVTELAVAMGIMAKMNVQSAIPYALSLSILLVALTAAIGLLGGIAPLIPAAIPAVLGLGVVVAELALLLAAIGGLAQIPGLQWLISEGGDFLQSIGTALGQFVGGIVGGIAKGMASSLPEIGISLSMFMSTVQGFISGAQGINENLLTGVKYLTSAIVLLLGAEFLAGVASLSGTSLIDLGFQLSGFIQAATPFLTSIQSIDPSAVEAAKTLAEMILILTAAEMISGISSFVGGSVDFSSFGTQLASFGSAVCEFSNILKSNGGIDEDSITSAANAGKSIAELQNALYGSGGLKQDIFGEKDLTMFASQLVSFGSAICAFSNIVRSNGGIDESSVESAVKAGESIAGLQNALYGSGGLKQDIFGEKDLSLFSTQLVAFGSAICGFSNVIKNNGGINEEAVTAAYNAGKVMATLQSEIEAAGGLKQDIFGEKDLGTFGTQIKLFGQAMVDFSRTVTGNISEEAVTAASNAGKVMAQVQAAIPEDKWFDGKISIDDFGKKIVKFGEGIVSYSNKVVNVNVDAVNNSLTAAKTLVSIAKSVIDLDVSGIETFKSVKSIGTTISEYYKNISGVEFGTVSSSISSVKSLISMIRNMSGLDSSGANAFKNAINTLATTDMSGFIAAFNDTAKFAAVGNNIVAALRNGIVAQGPTLTVTGTLLANNLTLGITSRQYTLVTTMNTIMTAVIKVISDRKEMFNSMGVLLMSRLAAGISTQSQAVRTAAASAASNAVNGIRAYYDSFYNAGSYLVDGFASGISANAYKAEAKARAMASAAASAARSELQIKSPSRVGYEIGDFFGIGFVKGVDGQITQANYAGADIANAAREGLSNAIGKVRDLITMGIDTQPTIRPVLDLSNIESGANAISNLFNSGGSIGVMSNVGAINTMMNQRNQNGVNDDVISAIDKLRGRLDNIGNTYYTIDGITYSSGTEVADAITSLTRAIKMEGRV